LKDSRTALLPRIASRNFVTGCLTSNVTETVTLEVLEQHL